MPEDKLPAMNFTPRGRGPVQTGFSPLTDEAKGAVKPSMVAAARQYAADQGLGADTQQVISEQRAYNAASEVMNRISQLA